jgi:thiol-disulfide isomerase/thioredoxin
MDYFQQYQKYKLKYLKLKNIQYGGTKPKFILFKSDKCGYCISFKPVWERISKQFKKSINFVVYDAETDHDIMNTWNIQGYPTLIFQKGGEAIEYMENRNEESLIKFLNTQLE